MVAIGLVVLAIALGITYAVMGPKFILDDWFTIDWRSRLGLLHTSDQLHSRPGAWLTFVLEFGVIGRHPLVIHLLQVALAAIVAVLLFRVARHFLPTGLAGGLAALWVVLPDHSSLERWASTMGIQMSLVLFLAGALLLTRAAEDARRPVAAVVLFVASALCYEATLPASAVALVALPWLKGRRPRPRALALELAPLAATGLWMLAHIQHEKSGWFSFGLVYSAHFGWGVTPTRGFGVALGVAAAVLASVAVAGLVLPGLRHLDRRACWLVVAGLLVIAIGTIPFARYAIEPLALGDRANVVSSLGAACVWLGALLLLWQFRALAISAAVVLAALFIAKDAQRDIDYARAGRDASRILAAVGRAYPASPSQTIVVGPTPIYHHGVVGLIGIEDQAGRPFLRRPDIHIYVAQHAREFYAAPPGLRVDTRAIGASTVRPDS
ncbi:MAG: hypothetical protein JO075_03555 [Acidimicrobiia bacterium]|nr:hypothetical protein [Acidimicrobiia bacterium]